MAAQGQKWTNFYVQPVCSPTRAALMTGRYATRFGFEFTPAPVAFERMVGTESEPGALHSPTFFKDRLKDMPPGSTEASPSAVNMLSVPTSEVTMTNFVRDVVLAESDLLTTLSDNSKMWVYFNVPEAEYLNYKQHEQNADSKIVGLRMANNQLFDQTGIVETMKHCTQDI